MRCRFEGDHFVGTILIFPVLAGFAFCGRRLSARLFYIGFSGIYHLTPVSYTRLGSDYARKEDFKWMSVIRLPDFVTREDFDWAVRKATAKKKQDFSKAEFFSYEEGLCVQCLSLIHI